MKHRAALLMTTLALAACEDLDLGCDECVSDADCPDGFLCGSNAAGARQTCFQDDTPEPPALVGECSRPFARVLPFSFAGDTSDLVDAHEVSCAETAAPEIVFRIQVPEDGELHVVASDASGQGIAVELLAGSTCEAPVDGCAAQSNGNVDEVMTATGSSPVHLLVIERNPSGPFTLDVELLQ